MSFNSFPDKKLIASLSAKMLIEIGAINFRPSNPYILTSGKASPVYIDCRKIISYPRVRSALMDFGASVVLRDIGFESIDAIAGGETAGIPFAAWLSERRFQSPSPGSPDAVPDSRTPKSRNTCPVLAGVPEAP